MRALIVYESMYGNTHVVANHIADGLRPQFEVDVVSVEEATPERIADADLLVVGGPTHVHGMSSEKSRKAAKDSLSKPGTGLRLDADAESEGLRDWFHGLAHVENRGAAAFDTRIDASPLLTGRASRGIEKRLTRLGYDLVADPESFLVDKTSHLLPGEAERAAEWAAELAASLAANP
jgi:hypothetical protein